MPPIHERYPELPTQAQIADISATATATTTQNQAHFLASHLRDHIDSGVLEPGFQLPIVRAAAGALGIDPWIVARAYRMLNISGHSISQRRRGTFVGRMIPPAYMDAVEDLADQVATGELTSGNPFPSVPDIKGMYHMANENAKATLGKLRQRGLARSVRGSGNFVTEQAQADPTRVGHFLVGPGTDISVWTNNVAERGYTHEETVGGFSAERNTRLIEARTEQLASSSGAILVSTTKHDVVYPRRLMPFARTARWIRAGDDDLDISQDIAYEDTHTRIVSPTYQQRMHMRIPHTGIQLMEQRTVSFDDRDRPRLVTVRVFPSNRGEIFDRRQR